MTEAGLTLFNQGRVREAVDQFTKAIALDPRYRDAWANRAKAYSELGLSDKAAAGPGPARSHLKPLSPRRCYS